MSVVVMVAGRHPTLGGGSASYVRAWGRAAIAADYAPHIFCVSTKTRTESAPYGTVHSVQPPFRPFRGVMLASHGPFIFRAIEVFAADHRGRLLIHSFGCWGGVGLEAARRVARRGIKCRTVVTPFTTAMHEGRGKLRGAASAYGWRTTLQHCGELLRLRLTVVPSEKRGPRGADAVLVNYDSVRRIVGAAFGKAIRIERITYAPETAFLRHAEHVPMPDVLRHLEPKDAPLILAISSHNARKGLHVLLHALAQMRREGLRFRACLVGDGALLDRHRRLAAALGLGSCTVVPGRVPVSFDYLRHADIFALPSLEEGSGSVSLLEAMQAGVASVVSGVDGLPEDVSDGTSALLVPPGDVGAMARALRALVEDSALRGRIARGAQAQFRARFTAEAFAAEVARAYRRLGFAPAAPIGAA